MLTKLFIPATRPELVSRSRLIEQLDHGIHNKLTLISAPAGFGKTTLVTDWLQSQGDDASSPFLVAWQSLDEGDNDVVRFLTYLISALNRLPGLEPEIGVGALQMLQASQPPPPETILIALINELALAALKIVLILDDYHLIDSQPVHDSLNFLIENLPPQLHLVIATREDPPIQISRLRARGQLTELRAVDLRFTSEETAKFLNQVMGLNLSAADIDALGTRTEGWIAGLQLAAISMQGLEDTARFINTFTGSNRMILDYLIEEVLNQQSKDIQTFLLQTSILNQLTGSLCNALTGQGDGQVTLEALERANLFVIPLDDERRWYRYHHLFADLLKERLSFTRPDLTDDMHSKAVVWHETNGDLSEAIYHALAASDTETATRLIEKGSLEALKRGELWLILTWVDRLPDTALASAPLLFIHHTWVLVMIGQLDVARSRIENIDWVCNAIKDTDEKQKIEVLGLVAGLKAILMLWDRDYKKGLEFANQAVINLPKDNWVSGYCATVEGFISWAGGDLDSAQDAFAQSFAIGQACGDIMLMVSAVCNLAHAIELKGHLRKALKLFQDSFQFAKLDGLALPVAGYSNSDLARILYELNDLEAASQHLEEGIDLCQMLGDKRAETIAHCLLARVRLAQGKHADVLDSIEKARDAGPMPGTPFDLRGGEFPQIGLWLKESKLKDLETWLMESGIGIDDEPHFKTKLTYAMHARVLVALGREYPDGTYLDDALNLLEKLLGIAESYGWGRRMIEILALQALALELKGDIAQAMQSLERALALAEPEGYIRTFVDEGPPMAKLLYEALSREIAPEYVRKLLAAFPGAKPEKAAVNQPKTSDTDWIEPLSDRELEVLLLIADGLSRQEIATKLVLSLNTIKTHARNAYSKLGVNNQMQATVKAKSLGLLENE
jgi:LuxR family transcriptional regulator, maltose regulon positive regulatory protein